MTQQDLFGVRGLEPKQQAVAREKREQETQIRRVAGGLRRAIEDFVRQRAASPEPQFTAEELRDYVAMHARAAPGSADRILRLLRLEGHLNYRVIDRSRSLYEALPVPR